MTYQQLYAFVKSHHRLLTVTEMAYECEVGKHVIDRICKKKWFVPIKQSERNNAFIMEYYQKKPLSWIAQKLNFGIEHTQRLYRALHIKEPSFKDSNEIPIKPIAKVYSEEKKISVRDVFSGYKILTSAYTVMDSMSEALRKTFPNRQQDNS